MTENGHGRPMVEAVGIHKSFGSTEVLRGIDLTVQPGEVACVIGPSGSGKSTFLRCINHLESIDAGTMSVDGELIGYRRRGDKLYELRESEVARQRRDIGMVFQRFNLFPHMTALENVMEAPLHGAPELEEAGAGSGAWACWSGSGWATGPTTTRRSSRAGSSSAWRSPGRWRWSRG